MTDPRLTNVDASVARWFDARHDSILKALDRAGAGDTGAFGDVLAEEGFGSDAEESYNLAESALDDLRVARIVTQDSFHIWSLTSENEV